MTSARLSSMVLLGSAEVGKAGPQRPTGYSHSANVRTRGSVKWGEPLDIFIGDA